MYCSHCRYLSLHEVHTLYSTKTTDLITMSSLTKSVGLKLTFVLLSEPAVGYGL